MVMNAFTMMMGAARKKSQPALPLEVVDVAPVVKIKKGLGRPPTVKKALLLHYLTEIIQYRLKDKD
jgi:hypothetical protein